MFDQIFLRKPGEDLHYVIQLTYMYLNPDELVFVVTFQQFSSRQSVLIHTNVLNHSRNHKMHHTSDANYSNNSSPRLVIEAGGGGMRRMGERVWGLRLVVIQHYIHLKIQHMNIEVLFYH